MEEFRKLGLNNEILEAVKRKGFEKPSPIQEKTIPLVLQGSDVLAGSRTGSGKTFAFSAGIIQKLGKQKTPFALILVPTRELAEQVGKEIQSFTTNKQVKVAKVYGGVSMNPQIQALRTANIIVATPGRLLDHQRSGTVNLNDINILVLDEADRMLDMGFISDIEDILKHTPKSRQTLLYTATLRPELLRISQKYMNHPEQVQVEQHVSKEKLKQVYYDVRNHSKISLLIHLLKNEDSSLSMVFCNTRHQVDLVTNILKENGVKAVALHGGLTQNRRNQVMKSFDDAKTHILVCTDVSARGIHVDDVSHVYNYDIPRDPKEYTHRIGRTARAGKEGLVINIITPNDHGNFGRVQHENRSYEIKKEQLPDFEKLKIDIRAKSEDQRRNSRQGNNRSGGNSKGFGQKRKGSGGFNKSRSGSEDSKGPKKRFFGNKNSNKRPRRSEN